MSSSNRTRRPRKLRLLRALSPVDRALLFSAYWLIPAISLRLRLFGFKRGAWQGHAPRISGDGEAAEPPRDAIRRRARARRAKRLVAIASRYSIYKGTCLSRSLALASLLERQGIDCALRIGVRNLVEFEAHAWVEMDGIVLNERPHIARHFIPIASSVNGLVTGQRTGHSA